MAAAVVQALNYQWKGAYPLAFTHAIPSIGSGATGLLVFMNDAASYTFTPTATYGGATMTLIGQIGSGTGTLWVWYLDAPVASGTLSIAMANTYGGDAAVKVISLSGTKSGLAIGASDFKAGGTATTNSIVMTGANSIVIAEAFGVYTGGTVTNTSSSPAATLIDADSTNSNLPTRAVTAQGLASGATSTVGWSVPYNQVNSVALEILAGGAAVVTPSNQTITGTGRASSVVFGTAKVNRNVKPTGLASTNAFGSPTLTLTPPKIRPAGIAPTSVLGALKVVYKQTVSPVAIASTLAFGAASVSSGNEAADLAPGDGRFTLTRTGAATAYASDSTMTTYAGGAARLAYDQGVKLGVMLEDAGSNSIKDNSGATTSSGTVLPTGAGWYNGGVAGLTASVVGTGTEGGIPYIDYRFQGTNNTSNVVYPSVNLTAYSDTPAANGDTWTLSAYMRKTAGTSVRASDGYPMAALQCNICTSTGGYSSSGATSPPIFDSDTLLRDWSTFTISDSNCAYVSPLIALNVPANATIDFTLRIGLAQLEKRSYPASAIATSGSGGTRGVEAMTYAVANGTYSIQVEYVGLTGLSNIVTYANQTVSTGSWTVPPVAQFPYVKRIAAKTTLTARPAAVTSATAKGRNLGVAFRLSDYTGTAAYAALIKANAAIYCPEYEFKMDQIQASEGTFSWTVADNFAAQAATDGKKLRGHCLIWYAATPSWVTSAIVGGTTARWQGIIDSHVSNVMPRYTTTTWDVVNETIEPTDGISGGYRNSMWYQAAGAAYIAYAFNSAHANNTKGAKLHLAEYGTEENDTAGANRRSSVLALLTNLVNAGVPIDGVSLQCHLDIERPYSASIHKTWLQSIRNLGLNIIVTELDVRAPAQDPTLEYDLRAAHRVREVLDTILAVGGGSEILTWDLSDTYTWLTAQFPSRTERPLPFDTSNQPKAMYAALQQAFEKSTAITTSAAQTVTGSGIISTAHLGSPTVTVKAPTQTIAPAGLAKTSTLGTDHTIVTEHATGIASTVAFGTAKVSRNVKPTGLASTATLGTDHTITTEHATGIASTVGFGTARIGVTIHASGIASTVGFGSDKASVIAHTAGIASTAALGQPVVTKGVVAVHPQAIASTAALGAPSVARGAVQVHPAGIASTVQFGTPVETAGAHLIQTTGIASTSAIGSDHVVVGPVSLHPVAIAPASVMGSPTVTKGTVAIHPAGITSTAQFGADHVIAGSVAVTPAGITKTSAVGSPLISQGAVAVHPAPITSTAQVGTLKTTISVKPYGIGSTVQLGLDKIIVIEHGIGIGSTAHLGSPTVTSKRMVSVTGLPSTLAFGTDHLVVGGVVITPAGIAPTSHVGSFLVQTGARFVQPIGIASTVTWGADKVSTIEHTPGIGSTAILGLPKVGTVAHVAGLVSTAQLGADHVITTEHVTGIASTVAFGLATVARGKVTIAPAGLASTAHFGGPVILTGGRVVNVVGIASTAALGTDHVTTGRVTVGPSGIASTAALGIATLKASVTIHANGIPNNNFAFGVVKVTTKAMIATVGLASTATMGSDHVLIGSRTISPAGIPKTSALGSPVIEAGAKFVQMSGIASATTFGRLTVLRGAVAVHPIGVAPVSRLGAPLVGSGLVAIRPAGIGSTASLGAPSVARGAVHVAPHGLDSTANFGTPRLTLHVTVSGLASTGHMGLPGITIGSVNIHPAPIAATESVGSPVIHPGAITESTTGIGSTSGLGHPQINLKIAVPTLDNGEGIGRPALSAGPVSIRPASLDSGTRYGAPVIHIGGVSVHPVAIAPTEGFGMPRTSVGAVQVKPLAIIEVDRFGVPTIYAGISVVSPGGLDSTFAFGAPVIAVIQAPTGEPEQVFVVPALPAPIVVSNVPQWAFVVPADTIEAIVPAPRRL